MLSSALRPTYLSDRLVAFRAPHFLTDAFDQFFTGSVGDDFLRVLAHIPAAYETYIVGGVVRDLLLDQIRMIKKPGGDIDLVIKGATDSKDLQSSFRDFDFRVNRMGGIKFRVRPQGTIFDVWRIEDHINLSSAGPPFTIERLLRHFLLDVDAVLWDTETGDLYDYGCLRAIQAGEIDLVGPEGISPVRAQVQAAHILLIAYSTGFRLSANARDYVRKILRSGNREEVYAVFQEKQPGAMRALDRLIEEVFADLPHPVNI